MKKRLLLAAAVSVAALTVIGVQGAAGAPGDVTCTGSFAGVARSVTVPAGSEDCELVGATITQDLIVEEGAQAFVHDGATIGRDAILQTNAGADFASASIGRDLTMQFGAGVHLANAGIGRDLLASTPQTVQTGEAGDELGPLKIGRDLVMSGSTGRPFTFDSICSATVGHDVRVTDRSVTVGFSIGDEEACAGNGLGPNTIGHDLIVTGDSALSNAFFGPSSLEIGNNNVGHDLIFTGNTALPGGYLEVNDNVVGHDAICADNDPGPTPDDPQDGPNLAGHTNTCG
jgi:carbonic anhydrase/acetyltransferase-like protein (isoleucine patch superfamily)